MFGKRSSREKRMLEREGAGRDVGRRETGMMNVVDSGR